MGVKQAWMAPWKCGCCFAATPVGCSPAVCPEPLATVSGWIGGAYRQLRLLWLVRRVGEKCLIAPSVWVETSVRYECIEFTGKGVKPIYSACLGAATSPRQRRCRTHAHAHHPPHHNPTVPALALRTPPTPRTACTPTFSLTLSRKRWQRKRTSW